MEKRRQKSQRKRTEARLELGNVRRTQPALGGFGDGRRT